MKAHRNALRNWTATARPACGRMRSSAWTVLGGAGPRQRKGAVPLARRDPSRTAWLPGQTGEGRRFWMTEEELAAAAAAAVERIGRQLGAEVVPPGADPAQLLAPAAALRVAPQVELAARNQVRVHIRQAREEGQTWHEIGGLLGFGPLTAGTGESVAGYAFGYTVGPQSAAPWYDPPVFTWACPACGQAHAEGLRSRDVDRMLARDGDQLVGRRSAARRTSAPARARGRTRAGRPSAPHGRS
jgi:hypothetical protein